MSKVDFTNCPRVSGRAYNGANGKKTAVEFEGEVWILKFPSQAKLKHEGFSYSNSVISEHVGSTIYRLLGIDAQETKLGTHVNGKLKVVCACKDFTVPNKRLLDFCSIKNTVIDSESGGTGTELGDLLETISHQEFMDPTIVLRRFWDMFVVDAFLGNFDRHNGNWGFLVDDVTGKTELAPVFDNGSCLLPQADDDIMRNVLESEEELNARIFTFPGSMIKLNDKKINYADFIKHYDGSEFRDSLERLVPRIKALDIKSLIAGVEYISELQRAFLEHYLTARREKLFTCCTKGN